MLGPKQLNRLEFNSTNNPRPNAIKLALSVGWMLGVVFRLSSCYFYFFTTFKLLQANLEIADVAAPKSSCRGWVLVVKICSHELLGN